MHYMAMHLTALRSNILDVRNANIFLQYSNICMQWFLLKGKKKKKKEKLSNW